MPFDTAWSAIKDFANGGKLYPQDLDDAFAELGDQVASINVAGGFNEGPNVRRGTSVVAAAEARTNVLYGLLSTPDQVQNVVLPSGGKLLVAFRGLWKESVLGAARAAIFLNSNELRYGGANAAPSVQEAAIGGSNAGVYVPLASSSGGGLQSVATIGATDASEVTTGQIIGVAGPSGAFGGAVEIFAAAGTYTVSVQFKASSGTVTVKERKLWVESRSYG